MTPNEMLEAIQGHGIPADIDNTGGNCGAIIAESGDRYVMVTTDSGPWATPADDDYDRGDHEWFVTLWDSEDSWLDAEMVRDGDALTPADRVPGVVAFLLGV